MTWWNSSYPFRRKISIQAPFEEIPVNHPVTFLIEAPLLDNGKVRSDFADVEVTFDEEVLARTVEEVPSGIEVTFPLKELLEPNETSVDHYYVYYGNPSLTNAPVRPTTVFDDWPVKVPYDGAGISYTRPEEHWKDGVSETSYARASFTFEGDRVRWVSRVGSAYGIAEVQVDEGPWEEVNLFGMEDEEQPVYTVEDLSAGSHILRVRVSGRQDASSAGRSVKIVRFEYSKYLTVSDLGEEIDDLKWSSSVGGV